MPDPHPLQAAIATLARAVLQTLTVRAGGEDTQPGIQHNIALHREIAVAWAAAGRM